MPLSGSYWDTDHVLGHELLQPIDEATGVEGIGKAKQSPSKWGKSCPHDHREVDIGRRCSDAIAEDSDRFVDHREDQSSANDALSGSVVE